MLDHMFPENIAGPTLGFIISLYAITSGVAYFVKKNTSLNNMIKVNEEGYPVPKCFTSKHLFCGINMFYGASTMVTMVKHIEYVMKFITNVFEGLIGPDEHWPLANVVGMSLGAGLLIIGLYPFLRILNEHPSSAYLGMTRLPDNNAL